MMEERVISRPRPRHRRRSFPYHLPDLLTAVFFTVVLPLAGAAWLMRGAEPSLPEPPGIFAEAAALEQNGALIPPEDAAEGTPWNLRLVNYEHPIPEDLSIPLAEVPGGEKVDERIYQPLMELLEAAREGNWDQQPLVVSGYRTQDKQQSLYDDKVAKYRGQGYSEDEAKALAEEWVAIPGCSEHQAGLAVDLNGATYDVYFWLQENSWKYGFIFRYPGNKTERTGVAEEVWHYRYVGEEAAAEIYRRGLCLEEYLEEQEAEV
ncbi:MAG: M15 family metallopeptidase [Oscillibacter sp.]|nr:M15 family metallopeptidase [Oscillibacter sp.]